MSALPPFRPGDPGKRVDTLIPTAEWKDMRKAAATQGESVSLFVRKAIRKAISE